MVGVLVVGGIAVSWIPIEALTDLARALAGKRTDVTVSLTISIAISVVVSLAGVTTYWRYRVQRSTVLSQRERIVKLEARLEERQEARSKR